MGVESRKSGRKASLWRLGGPWDSEGFGRHDWWLQKTLGQVFPLLTLLCTAGQLAPASRTIDENKPTSIGTPRLLSFITSIFGDTCRRLKYAHDLLQNRLSGVEMSREIVR